MTLAINHSSEAFGVIPATIAITTAISAPAVSGSANDTHLERKKVSPLLNELALDDTYKIRC